MVKAIAGAASGCVFLMVVLPSPSAAQDQAILEQWRSGRQTPEVITVMDFPRGLLPQGATSLDLMVTDDPEDGTLLAVIGYEPGPVLFGTVPFEAFLNPAKTIAYYDHSSDLVVVSSEYPSRATRNNASFMWDSQSATLVPVETWVSDASARLLASADSLLELGEIREAADSISMMFYGWAYFDENEMACRILRAAHQAAVRADREEGREAALDCYDQLLYALEKTTGDEDWFITVRSREEYLSGQYAPFMTPDELAEILDDLAGILDDNGVAAEAVLRNTSELLEGDE